jgi:hypothetical protein
MSDILPFLLFRYYTLPCPTSSFQSYFLYIFLLWSAGAPIPVYMTNAFKFPGICNKVFFFSYIRNKTILLSPHIFMCCYIFIFSYAECEDILFILFQFSSFLMHIFPCLVIFKITYAFSQNVSHTGTHNINVIICVHNFIFATCPLYVSDRGRYNSNSLKCLSICISELWVFSVGDGTTEAHFSARQPQNPRCNN